MSTGGVFTIVANDGKADKLINAYQFLLSRIKEMMNYSSQMGMDTAAYLMEIEKTHIIHFNRKYKPYVPLGFEYSKVPPQSTATFGGTALYTIPVYGDFIHDVFVNFKISQGSCNPAPLPPLDKNVLKTGSNATAEPVTDIYIDGQAYPSIDTTNGILRKVLYDYVDPDTGNIVAAGDPVANNIYLCDFPGERIVQKANFTINGNTLDEYDQYAYVFYRNFLLCEDKKVSYYKNMGQEVEVPAYTDIIKNGIRQKVSLVMGNQTPKSQLPAVNLFVKLMFWFCKDPGQSLATAAIPYGTRMISIDIASFDSIFKLSCPIVKRQNIITYVLEKYDDTIVADPTPPGPNATDEDKQKYAKWLINYALTSRSNSTVPQYNVSVLFNPVDAVALEANTPQVNLVDPPDDFIFNQMKSSTYYLPVNHTASTWNQKPTLSSMHMWINNIFTTSEIHDIYVSKVGFNLIRIHKQQSTSVSSGQNSILLSQFKYPIEYIFFGVVPSTNSLADYDATCWHSFTLSRNRRVSTIVNLLPTKEYSSSENLHYIEKIPIINTLKVMVHGVELYHEMDQEFYNSYLSHNYRRICSPSDTGAMFINFALFPTKYQPSGHINISRAREFYIEFNSNVLGKNTVESLGYNSSTINPEIRNTLPNQLQGTAVACGSAMNFLLISEGNATLRYAT